MKILQDRSMLLDENDEYYDCSDYTDEDWNRLFIIMLDQGDLMMEEMVENEPQPAKFMFPDGMDERAINNGAYDGNCEDLVVHMGVFIVPTSNFDDIRSKLWADLYMFFGRRGPEDGTSIVYVANIVRKEIEAYSKQFACERVVYAFPGVVSLMNGDSKYIDFILQGRDTTAADMDKFAEKEGVRDLNKVISVFEKTVPPYYDRDFMWSDKEMRKAIHDSWCEACLVEVATDSESGPMNPPTDTTADAPADTQAVTPADTQADEPDGPSQDLLS